MITGVTCNFRVSAGWFAGFGFMNSEMTPQRLTSSPKTGPEKFEFSGGRSSPKKEENRDEKETQ